MTDLPHHDRFTLPGQIPDASDPYWKLSPAEQADWRARGLAHAAGRGWVPEGTPFPYSSSSPHTRRPGAEPAGGAGSRAPAAARKSESWPADWRPGDAPVQYVDADVAIELADDPAAASRVFDAPVRVRFLDCLATMGEVSAAAAHVGVSRETAYRARRRWPDFARLWDAAMLHARARAEGELATRAYHGIKVPVIVRGEVVATWRRQDPRYLFALLNRLDRKAAECAEAAETAERFEELLALHAGQAMPPGFAEAAGLWEEQRDERPDGATRLPTRREFAAYCGGEAASDAEPDEVDAVYDGASAAAEAEFDEWVEESRALVDAIMLMPGEEDGAEAAPVAASDAAPSSSEVAPSSSDVASAPSFVTPANAGAQGGAEPSPAGAPERDAADLPLEVKSAPVRESVSQVSTPGAADASPATIVRLRKAGRAASFRASEGAQGRS